MSVASRAIIPSAKEMIQIEGYAEDIAISEGIPASILKGIIWQESKFDRLSYRYNYNNPADRSYGLMHLNLSTAEQVCTQAYGYACNLTYSRLYEPIFNIFLGARYLKTLFNRYQNWNKAVAAYNAGSPRYTQAGTFINQGYVNAVVKTAQILSTSVIALAQKILR